MTKLVDHKAFRTEKGITHSYEQVMRLVEAGKFPKPVRIGCRNYWISEELDQHIADLVADRDGLPKPPVPMPQYVQQWAVKLPNDGARHSSGHQGCGNQRVEQGLDANADLEGVGK